MLAQLSVCLIARIGLWFHAHYTKETGEFNSVFLTFSSIEPETQVSLALAPAFILKYRWYPQHRWKVAAMKYSIFHLLINNRFGDISSALGTEVLNEDYYTRFVSVVESGRPTPTVLSLPEKSPYTALSVVRCHPESVTDVPMVDENVLNCAYMLTPEELSLSLQGIQCLRRHSATVIRSNSRIIYKSLREVPNTLLLEFR